MICEKKEYQSYKDAMRDVVGMNKKYKQKVRPYQCKECGLFHITTIHKNTIRGKKDSKYPIKINEIRYHKREKLKTKQPKKARSIELATDKIMSPEMVNKLKLLFECF
jgi:hypothetical protein